jgi:hypothetical protein
MKCVFLDIDGVLNDHPRTIEGHAIPQINHIMVNNLNTILEMTDARVVITSAWRYQFYRGDMTLNGFCYMLESHGIIRNRIIGVTKKDSVDYNFEWDSDKKTDYEKRSKTERAKQVREFISSDTAKRFGIDRYVVIDDLDLGFTEAKLPFVMTDPRLGLTYADAMACVAILNGK